MVKRSQNEEKHIEFVSYNGKFPNLCSGILCLRIDGELVKFGSKYNDKTVNYDRFWESGGNCGFTNGYKESYTNTSEWIIAADDLPDKYKKYVNEIDEVFNENVQHGCCGGCL